MTANRPAHSRNAGIDALRGAAILFVIMLHIGLRVPLKSTLLDEVFPRWFLSALNFNGYAGVFVFFVISGFLISTQAIRRWGSLAAINLREFYVRRAARILPLLLLLLAVLSLLHLAQVKHFTIDRADQSLPRALIAALGMHLNWYEGVTSYLPASWDVLWSLSIEEAFYIGFPLLCWVLRSRASLASLMLVLACSLPVWQLIVAGEVWNEKNYASGFAGIAMGVLGALIATQAQWLPPKKVVSAALIFGLIGVITALFGRKWLWPLIGNGNLLLLTFSVMLLIVALDWREQLGEQWGAPLRLPGTGWLQSFGRLSYEIYLTHMFVVWPVVLAFKASGIAQWWGAFVYPIAITLCWLLGYRVAKHITQPAERWVHARLLGSHKHPLNLPQN
jgi:peptidoglycan/LPS O-acetylase OafA/YrhL